MGYAVKLQSKEKLARILGQHVLIYSNTAGEQENLIISPELDKNDYYIIMEQTYANYYTGSNRGVVVWDTNNTSITVDIPTPTSGHYVRYTVTKSSISYTGGYWYSTYVGKMYLSACSIKKL